MTDKPAMGISNPWDSSAGEHHLPPVSSSRHSTMPRYVLPDGSYCTSQNEASLTWARHLGLIKETNG